MLEKLKCVNDKYKSSAMNHEDIENASVVHVGNDGIVRSCKIKPRKFYISDRMSII